MKKIVQLEVNNPARAEIRSGNAKLLFENGRELNALRLATESKKLPDVVLKEARSSFAKMADVSPNSRAVLAGISSRSALRPVTLLAPNTTMHGSPEFLDGICPPMLPLLQVGLKSCCERRP